jgi:hypothetical protein
MSDNWPVMSDCSEPEDTQGDTQESQGDMCTQGSQGSQDTAGNKKATQNRIDDVADKWIKYIVNDSTGYLANCTKSNNFLTVKGKDIKELIDNNVGLLCAIMDMMKRPTKKQLVAVVSKVDEFFIHRISGKTPEDVDYKEYISGNVHVLHKVWTNIARNSRRSKTGSKTDSMTQLKRTLSPTSTESPTDNKKTKDVKPAYPTIPEDLNFDMDDDSEEQDDAEIDVDPLVSVNILHPTPKIKRTFRLCVL